jgi:glycosyltransferase involved in cell wall biosynthesis
VIDSASSEKEQEIVQEFQQKYLYIIDKRTDKLEQQKNNQSLREQNQVCKNYQVQRGEISDLEVNHDLGVPLTEDERENLQVIQSMSEQRKPIVVIDGVIFQINQGGIARVWYSILQEWSNSEFGQHIIILDRNQTAPRLKNLKYWLLEAYDYNHSGEDARKIQAICDRLQAALFISTYYTTPLSTPSALMVHDMIPEVLEADLNQPEWQEKRYAILYASRYITISANTARDLVEFYPHITQDKIDVVYNGVSQEFSRSIAQEIDGFKQKYQILKPYFLIVGSRISLKGYKNVKLFFEAWNNLPKNNNLAVVCVGGDLELEPELSKLATNITTYVLKLDDQDLKTAYSGAIALVYPSLYEGFGLPIIEAMACGCPVITCFNSAIPEVGGDAVLYIDSTSIDEMIQAIKKIQIPEIRQQLIDKGLERYQQFSWRQNSEKISQIILRTITEVKENPSGQVWVELRKLQEEKQNQSLQQLITSRSLKEMEYSLEKFKNQNTQLLENIESQQEKIKSLSTAKSAIKRLLKIVIKKSKLAYFIKNNY